MKAQIILSDKENTEYINVDNILDRNCFNYIDSFKADNLLKVENNGIIIERKDSDHNTLVHLLIDDSYIEISTVEGQIKIISKTLAFNINNDIISLVYDIEGEVKTIDIKYLEV